MNNKEVSKCLLCHDAECSKQYKNIDVERIFRAIKFDNIKGARYLIKNEELSCRDGGHNAINFDEKRKPLLDGSKCVGCGLCRLVCPNCAIDKTIKRVNKK